MRHAAYASHPTDAERKLWQCLRAGQLHGLKFRRQHPIPLYVVDFYCEAVRLVVEVDGSQHTEEVDGVRTRFLESRGLLVLRFWSNEALTQTEAVIEAIFNAVASRTLTPTPLLGSALPHQATPALANTRAFGAARTATGSSQAPLLTPVGEELSELPDEHHCQFRRR